MKKILLALPLVAGASWAGSTYYAGTQAQPAYEKLLADLNQAAGGAFVLEMSDYQAGFTESVATTNVKLMHTDQPSLFQLKHQINHSPVGSDPEGARFSASNIATTLNRDTISDEDVRDFIAKFDDGRPFILYTDVGFNGDVTSSLQISSLSMDYENGTINFDGGRYEAFSDNGKVDVSGYLGQLALDNGSGALFTMAQSSAELDLLQVAAGVYTGDQQFTLPSITYNDSSSGIVVGVEDISFNSSASLHGDKLDTESVVSVAKIDAPVPLNSMVWDSRLNGLSLEGLEQYLTAWNDVMRMATADETYDIEEIESQMMNAYKGLLTPGSKFTNKITMTNDGGDVVGDIGIVFHGDGTPSGIDNMTTVADVLQSIVINLDLDADTAAIDLTPAAMFMMHPMAQQYIRMDGGKYSSNIAVADLMLTINGDQQPLEYYLGESLYEPLDFSAMADY